MATRLPEELLVLDELERKLAELRVEVELRKEEVRSNFQQLHSMIAVREVFVLRELDDIVTRVRGDIDEKKGKLQELNTAREDLDRDLTKNALKEVREKYLRELENEIRNELARDVPVGWIDLEWKREQLEESVIEACSVDYMDNRPVTLIEYSAKRSLVWSRDSTSTNRIRDPMQLVIHDKSQNIFVADYDDKRVLVFDGEGSYLYQIDTPSCPVGLALTDEYIFVSAGSTLVKIKISSSICFKSVETENRIWGMDANSKSEIYVTEFNDQSVCVFNRNLEFQRRIYLSTTEIEPKMLTLDIKLYADMMYVMFGSTPSPSFHLQVFTQDGELLRCLITQNEMVWSEFFYIDQTGNISVADSKGNKIKIYCNEGNVIHTITTDLLPGDQKIYHPRGIAIDKKNRIIVAQKNKKCNLLAL